MANAIASASVVLSANADPLAAGLGQASGKLDSWAKGEEAKAAAKGGKGGGIMGLLMMGANPVLAAAGAAGFAGDIVGNALGTLKDLSAVGKQAATLGIASDQFMGLSASAKKFGIEGDALVATFGKMGSKVTQAASGMGDAAATFKSLGLDAKALKSLSLDQQFITIADAIGKIPDKGGQAAAAMKLFEEGGLKMLPMFQQGRAGIEAFIAKQKEMGTALGQNQMDAVIKAQAAMPKLEAAFKGLWYQLVAAAAPAIEKIATLLGTIWERAQPAIKVFAALAVGYLEMITRNVTFIYDAIKTVAKPIGEWFERLSGGVSVVDWIKDRFEEWGFIASEVFSAIISGLGQIVEAVGQWITDTFGVAEGFMSLKVTAFDVLRGIGVIGGYIFDTLKAGVGAVSLGMGEIIKGFADIGDVLSDLVKRIPERFRPAGLDSYLDWGDKVRDKSRQVGDSMADWGRNAMNSFGDSAKQANKMVDAMEARFEASKLKRAQEKMAEAMAAPTEAAPAEPKLAAAMDRFSKEAYTVIARVSAGQMFGPANDAQKQIAATQGVEKAVREQTAAIKGLKMGVI